MAANMMDDFFFIFFIEIEIFRGEVKMLMRHTHDTTFSENILDSYKILEESEQSFILFLKDNGKSAAVFPQVLEDRTLSGTPPPSLL
jgi:hypothetical protein